MNYGVSDHARVECKVSKHHGSFPANERCPWCEPKSHHAPVMSADWIRGKEWVYYNAVNDTYSTDGYVYTIPGISYRNALRPAQEAPDEPEDPDTDAYQYMVFP